MKNRKRSKPMVGRWFGSIVAVLALLSACSRPSASAAGGAPEVIEQPAPRPESLPVVQPFDGHGELRFFARPDAPVLQVELARTEPERARGLMFRRSLEPQHGMLFFMPGDDDWKFWMKNTLLRLDMVFLDQDWQVVGVLEDVPPLNEIPRGVGTPSRYVLELGAWEARRQHISLGTRLQFRELPDTARSAP
jgi:uncharacterized membrane protein (UPF0127 family)